MLPLSGGLSDFGDQARLGLELAVDRINQSGGILGHQVSIDYRDDMAEPAKAEEAAKALTSDPDVLAVAGPITSASRNAISAIMINTNTPLLYATDYEGGDCGSNLFYFNSVPNQRATPLMRFLIENAGTQFFLLGADYIWPHAMFRACTRVIESEGGNVVNRRYVPLDGLADYAPVVKQIGASGATVLVLALPGKTHLDFIAAAAGTPVLDQMTIGNLGAIALYGAPANPSTAVYGCAPFVQSDPLPTVQDFVASARKKAGDKRVISAYVATHYNALIALGMACSKAGEVSRDAVLSGLPGLQYATPSGRSQIDATTNHSTLRMQIARATATGPVVVPDKQATVIEAEAACVTGG
ncbi:MAG: ABC transporter substrate-binding protein [Pseudomonadota bacterium]